MFTVLKFGDVIYVPNDKAYFYVHSFVYSTHDAEMVARVRPKSNNSYDVNFITINVSVMIKLGYCKV